MSVDSKKLRGTYRPDRENKESPKLDLAGSDFPAPPLVRQKPIASRKWKQLLSDDVWGLVITKADLDALELYCLTYARMRKAQQELRKGGGKEVLEDENGRLYPNPWVRILEKAHDTLHKFQVQFGGLPAVRSRVTARKPEKKNAFGDL